MDEVDEVVSGFDLCVRCGMFHVLRGCSAKDVLKWRVGKMNWEAEHG